MAYCQDCADAQREIGGMADEIAFWAFQAKWYYAAANGMGSYDDLPVKRQKAIAEVFKQRRIAENRERIGHVEPAHDIGS